MVWLDEFLFHFICLHGYVMSCLCLTTPRKIFSEYVNYDIKRRAHTTHIIFAYGYSIVIQHGYSFSSEKNYIFYVDVVVVGALFFFFGLLLKLTLSGMNM